MKKDSLEFAKLELLSLSQNRVLLAKAHKWDELAANDALWTEKLQQATDRFAEALNPILPQLVADTDQLMSLVESQQKQSLVNLKRETAGLLQAQKYLK